MFKAISPKQVENCNNAINVSSYGHRPYNRFSPFTYSQDFRIPVPGQDELYSNSVESIWQGLKVIDGSVDFELFTKKPKKRKGNVEGHLFNGSMLDIVSARKEIYKPAYFNYLDNYVSDNIKEDLISICLKDPRYPDDVFLYDVEDNLDIETDRPLAHSIFASEYMDKYFQKRFEETRSKIDVQYDKTEKQETLAGPICRAIDLYELSSEFDKKMMIHFLARNTKVRDIYHARYYVRLFEKLEGLER